MNIVVGITGASGYRLAHEVVRGLGKHEVNVHLITTKPAETIAAIEGENPEETRELAYRHYREDELEACISSSTCPMDGMVIVPCSLKSLSAITHGYCNNLIIRCAENMLRMKKPLVVMPRETPLSAQALDNMAQLVRDGAIMLPPIIEYYTRPHTIEDLNHFFVGKVLDTFAIKHNYPKWRGIR